MEVHYIDTTWPVVCIKIVGVPKDKEDIHKIINIWSQIYVRSMTCNEKFKLVFDAREASLNNVELLRVLAEFLIKVKLMTEQWMDRTSILVSEEKIRNLIKFVFLLYKPVRPFKVFTNAEKSLEWVQSDEPGEDPDKNFLKEKPKKKNIISRVSFK